MDRPFGWDYPPGVTGSEPQITGEWSEDEDEVLEADEIIDADEERCTCTWSSFVKYGGGTGFDICKFDPACPVHGDEA